MYANLLLFFRSDLSFFLDEFNILEVFHFLINYFHLQAKPDVACDAEVVNPSAGWIVDVLLILI
jgi:hypothetical protein